jgi:hypothetical protein
MVDVGVISFESIGKRGTSVGDDLTIWPVTRELRAMKRSVRWTNAFGNYLRYRQDSDDAYTIHKLAQGTTNGANRKRGRLARRNHNWSRWINRL